MDIKQVTDPAEKETISRSVLEVLPDYWDKDNPCQIYIMYLQNAVSGIASDGAATESCHEMLTIRRNPDKTARSVL